MSVGGLARGAVTVAAFLAFVAPVAAQTQAASGVSSVDTPNAGIAIGGGAELDPATAEKRREIERAYKNATAKIPAQTAVNDPWAGMRGTDEAKPAAKPGRAAKKKPQ